MKHRRQHQKQKQDRLGFTLIGLVLTLMLSGGSWFVYSSATAEVEIDENGCLRQAEIGKLVILLDQSDTLLPLQRIDARKSLTSIIDTVPTGTKVSLWALDAAQPSLISQIYEGCKPRDGRNVNPLYENRRRLQAAWQEDFITPLNDAVDDAMNVSASQHSPIFEALQQLSVRAFASVSRRDGNDKLVILSDLMQNMPQYSHYRDSCNYEQFSQLPYASEVRSELHHISVDVLYLGRPGLAARQTTCHGYFWERYFQANGASIASIKRVIGG